MDEDSIVTISKTGNYTLQPQNYVENTHIYSGRENKITLSRFYNIRFLCYYNMQWYPFDVQVLFLIPSPPSLCVRYRPAVSC